VDDVSSHTDIICTEGPLVPVLHAATTRVDIEGTEVGLADIAELYALFTQVSDPRRPRGVRHGIATVLTVMVLVVLAGARNFREAGDQAADLPDLLLHAAVARRDPRTGALVALSPDPPIRFV
jgi:hypothetical protein